MYHQVLMLFMLQCDVACCLCCGHGSEMHHGDAHVVSVVDVVMPYYMFVMGHYHVGFCQCCQCCCAMQHAS